MKDIGSKIAQKRKELGYTQSDLADRLFVTRQTVGRWENGDVLPDIEKIPDIANMLGVTCDYLLKDEIMEDRDMGNATALTSPLLMSAVGKTVRLNFFDEEADIDLVNVDVTILSFEGNWMRVETHTKKGRIEKLISLSSVLSLEFKEQEE